MALVATLVPYTLPLLISLKESRLLTREILEKFDTDKFRGSSFCPTVI